jgi:hypothetical protein
MKFKNDNILDATSELGTTRNRSCIAMCSDKQTPKEGAMRELTQEEMKELTQEETQQVAGGTGSNFLVEATTLAIKGGHGHKIK